MAPEKRLEFGRNTFHLKFRELFEKWKNCWESPGRGPFKIILGGRHLSPEQLEAEKPEQEALENLVLYCATAVVAGGLSGNGDAVIDAILAEYHGQESTTVAYPFFPDFLIAVFKKTLEIQNTMKVSEASSGNIQGLRDLLKIRISTVLPFINSQ
jgi:hypothetical protein